MVDFDLAVCPARCDERAEIHTVVGLRGDRDRHSKDVLQRALGVFRELDADEVLVSRGGIDPEVPVHRDAGIHGDNELLNDIFGSESELSGFDAVYIKHKVGCVIPLLNPDIDSAGNRLHKFADFSRFGEELVCRAAFDLDVDWRCGTQIQRGGDHAACVELGLDIRKFRFLEKPFAKLLDKLHRTHRAGRSELHANDGILLSRVRRVGRGPVGIEADLRNDRDAVGCRNFCPEEVLDLLDALFRRLETKCGWSSQADGQLAGINFRKKLASDFWRERDGGGDDCENGEAGSCGMGEAGCQSR